MPAEVAQARRWLLGQAAAGAGAASLAFLIPGLHARQLVWPDTPDLLLLAYGLAVATAGVAFAWAVRLRSRQVRAAVFVVPFALLFTLMGSLILVGDTEAPYGVLEVAVLTFIPTGVAVRLMFTPAAAAWFRVPPGQPL